VIVMDVLIVTCFFLGGLLIGFVVGFLYGGWLAQAPAQEGDTNDNL
jgi:hypothetical protein